MTFCVNGEITIRQESKRSWHQSFCRTIFALYSCLTMVRILSLQNGTTLTPAERWRRGRRLMHQLTMPAVAVTYEPVQMLESTKALFKLMQNPAAYQQIFEQYSGGLMFRIGYGKEIVTGKEPQLLRILQVNHNLERIASPGSYLVDTIPSLKYLPSWLAPFKQEASRLHAEEYSLFHELLGDVRHAMRQGEAVASFAKQFVLEQERFALSDEEGTYVLGTLFEAGSGTTSAAMMSFCLAMTLFPEWQDLACKEIEEVCGEQIPVFRDVPQLPMVRAVIKEVLRWRPVTAGGVPHQLIRDDVYDGFFLPAGSVVHANQWAIHREPALYPDAERFNPNRWLSPEYPTYREPLSQFPNLQNFSSFGFGRRICPGQNIAERSLYILTARIIWAGRFSKKKDSAGCEIDVPDYDYISGFNTQPNPFPFDYRPRSRAKYVLVETAWNNAQKERAHQ